MVPLWSCLDCAIDPEWECGYTLPRTPHTSPEVRLRDLSPSNSINTSNANAVNKRQGSSTGQNFKPTIPTINIMAGADIKLPIFNGNMLEYPKQH